MTQRVDVDYFRRRVGLLLVGLRSRFDELESRDFPTATIVDLIELVRRILLLVEQKVPSADDKTLPLIFNLLCDYQDLLGYLDNAHTEQTPRGLVILLNQLLGKVSNGSRFFASPQGSYNYSIASLGDFVGRQLGNFLTKAEIASLPPLFTSTIHLVMFPRAERDSILVHSLFGHEVGHLLADAYLDHESSQPKFADTLKEKVDKCVALRPPDSTLQGVQVLRYMTQLQRELRQVRKRAMEELLSDYAGLLIFGPSALFASYEVFSLDDLDSPPVPNQYYPPSRFRMRFLVDVLKGEGYGKILEEIAAKPNHQSALDSIKHRVDLIEEMTVETSDLLNLDLDPIVKIAYEWAQESLTDATTFVKAKLPPDLIYSATTVSAEVSELVERLMLGIPPNELGTYPDASIPSWQSALLAGWACRLEGKKYSNDGVEVTCENEDFLNINTLCLRALESIFLRIAYDKHMTSEEAQA